MKNFVKTEHLILSRYIVDDPALLFKTESIGDDSFSSSPEKLAQLIKKNNNCYQGILGWWNDISSAYSAKRHILEDNKLWKREEQLQYYIYEKEGTACVGIICALCENKKAYVLGWLSEEAQGKHYAAEIQKAMDAELFLTMELECVCRECSKNNPNFERVSAFLTHDGGYTITADKQNATVWEKTKSVYFQENPYLSMPKELDSAQSQKSTFSWAVMLFARQKGKGLG